MKELKWYFIMSGAMFIGMFTLFSIDSSNTERCRSNAMAAHYSESEITNICKSHG